MSTSWSSLGVAGQRRAAQRFVVCDDADRLLETPDAGGRTPGMADLYAWAADPARHFGTAERAALLRDPALRHSFRLLVARIASVQVPAAAAASSGRLDSRSGPGLHIRLIASRADPTQVYVVLELDPDIAASALLILRDGVPVLRVALPPATAGHMQLIEADDSPVVMALRDPATELALM